MKTKEFVKQEGLGIFGGYNKSNCEYHSSSRCLIMNGKCDGVNNGCVIPKIYNNWKNRDKRKKVSTILFEYLYVDIKFFEEDPFLIISPLPHLLNLSFLLDIKIHLIFNMT